MPRSSSNALLWYMIAEMSKNQYLEVKERIHICLELQSSTYPTQNPGSTDELLLEADSDTDFFPGLQERQPREQSASP